MSLLSWNCRGASNSKSPIFSFLGNLAAKCNVDFLFLSETKSLVCNLEPYFRKMGFSSSSGFDADGSSGGLFLGWSHRVNVNVVSVSENIIFCNVISEVSLS